MPPRALSIVSEDTEHCLRRCPQNNDKERPCSSEVRPPYPEKDPTFTFLGGRVKRILIAGFKGEMLGEGDRMMSKSWVLSVLCHCSSGAQADGQQSLPAGQGPVKTACRRITTWMCGADTGQSVSRSPGPAGAMASRLLLSVGLFWGHPFPIASFACQAEPSNETGVN